jgi:hemolysin-activating ACP:hemolysin acyltransferase
MLHQVKAIHYLLQAARGGGSDSYLKNNLMQQILKALDNMQQPLYWLSHISCRRPSAWLYWGFVPEPIESNSSLERKPAFR